MLEIPRTTSVQVLSVCTVQFKAVCDAIRAGMKRFMLQALAHSVRFTSPCPEKKHLWGGGIILGLMGCKFIKMCHF